MSGVRVIFQPCLQLSWIGALFMATSALAAESNVAKPSFEGVWQIDKPVKMLVGENGKRPPLNPSAKRLYDRRIARMKAGDVKSYDATTLCKPMGDPRTAYEGKPFDIVQGEDVIFVGYTWNRMARLVYMNDQHSEIQGPAYYGSWMGKWDGDTLVFDGVGFNDTTLLDAAGMPHSEALHLVQRLTLKDGGMGLEIQTTFDDPQTFSRSWTAVHNYRKLPGAIIHEDLCPQRLKLTIY